jgi:hypothetical protein
VTPGKSGGGGVYPSGGTAGRRRKSFGAAAFVNGEGLRWSPVEVMKSCSLGEVRGEGFAGNYRDW